MLKQSATIAVSLSICSAVCFSPLRSKAQASQTVSEIITTYNGYWKSGFNAMNPVKPNTSHNLLAFTYNGTSYSTGVNDQLLHSHGDENFSPQIFHSLPVLNITGTVTSNTKIALGQLYDGVDNGASHPPPANSLAYYLTDGSAGLDLGTGIANLPAGDLIFNISGINPVSIGDGVPDILITQIADPSNGTDKYEFTNSSGSTVGQIINISFSGINEVGNWTGDFYEASTTPMTLASSFTRSDRPLRLWAADFSYFGITTANYSSIKKFRIHLNGASDVAFIAYNLFSSVITLPSSLSNFSSSVLSNNVTLTWKTQFENNTNHFEIETSQDGVHFDHAGTLPAAGNRSAEKNYSYVQPNVSAGMHYYRLTQYDNDGKFVYSNILKETITDNNPVLSVFPNPASDAVVVKHAVAKAGDKLELFSETGKRISSINMLPETKQTKVDLTTLSIGSYFFRLVSTATLKETIKFSIK